MEKIDMDYSETEKFTWLDLHIKLQRLQAGSKITRAPSKASET